MQSGIGCDLSLLIDVASQNEEFSPSRCLFLDTVVDIVALSSELDVSALLVTTVACLLCSGSDLVYTSE